MVSACPESDLRSLTRDGLKETFIKGKCTNDINLPPVSESLIQPLVKYTRMSAVLYATVSWESLLWKYQMVCCRTQEKVIKLLATLVMGTKVWENENS